MTAKTPHFPGKGEAEPVPGWTKVMCPFLTAGEVARYQDNLVVTAGAQKKPPAAQSCKGPACALFCTVRGADGTSVSGCAPVHQMMMLNTLNTMVGTFIEAARAGAVAEQQAAAAPPTAAPATNPTT